LDTSTTSKPLTFDPEIERTLRNIRRQKRSQMAGREEGEGTNIEQAATNEEGTGRAIERSRKLKDYHTSITEGYGPSIVRPPIGQNNFELKPGFISMIQNHVQFFGLPNEDPNQHITNFLEYCDTVKMNGVSNDAIRLRLFSFSLRDKAKAWV